MPRRLVMSPGYLVLNALVAFQKGLNLDQQERQQILLFPPCMPPVSKGPDFIQEVEPHEQSLTANSF